MSNFQAKSGNTLHGPMTWIASDVFIGRSLEAYGQYSAYETVLFQHFVVPGATVLDVGANIGVFTVALVRMATPTGRVLAFEPQTEVFGLLSSNVEANCLTNVTLHQAGIGREAGTLNVPVMDYAAEGNFGGVELSSEPSGGTSVDIITIDSLNLDACRLIKIDVEGMETEVIAGGTKTIKRLRPILYVESDRKQNAAELILAILGLDYRLYLHLAPLFEPNNFYKNTDNIFGKNVLSANMLCLPGEIEQNIEGLKELKAPEDLISILP
jgi:FkbM family methyltransferase